MPADSARLIIPRYLKDDWDTAGADGKLSQYQHSTRVHQPKTVSEVLGGVLTTRGDVLRRGASAAERLALGTANQVLRSNGTDVAWATLAYLPGNHVETIGVTSGSSFTLSTTLTVSKTYMLHLRHAAPASDAQLRWRVTHGGVVMSSINSYNYASHGVGAGGSDTSSSNGNTYIGNSGTFEATSGYGQLWMIFGQHTGTQWFCHWSQSMLDSSANHVSWFGTGTRKATTTVDGLQFHWSTGDIASLQGELWEMTT